MKNLSLWLRLNSFSYFVPVSGLSWVSIYLQVYCPEYLCTCQCTVLSIFIPASVLSWVSMYLQVYCPEYLCTCKCTVLSIYVHASVLAWVSMYLQVYCPESSGLQLMRTIVNIFPLLEILTLSASLSSRGLLSLKLFFTQTLLL